MGSGKRPVNTCIRNEQGISCCSARLTNAICHGGEFSSQVSGSGVGCCSAAVVALGVGSCSAAFERSGVFAGQRRAAAAQLGSAGRWQRQRGVGVGSVADAAQRRSAKRSSARQRSALAVVAQWWQGSAAAIRTLQRSGSSEHCQLQRSGVAQWWHRRAAVAQLDSANAWTAAVERSSVDARRRIALSCLFCG